MNLLPWSYSKLTSFERCPRYGRAKYIDKSLPYVESPAAKEGNECHAAIEAHVNNSEPLPAKWTWVQQFIPDYKAGDTLKAEGWLNVNADGTPAPRKSWFTTKIDLLQIEDGDIAWIIDWKTGKPWEDPDQLKCYSVAVKAHYPHVRHWRGMYVWLKEKRVGEVHTLSPARTLTKLQERVAKVDTSDTPKPNKLCDWCELQTCEFYTGRKGHDKHANV